MYDSSNANNVNQESSCTYQCAVTMDMLNGDGLMKPGGYQKLICDVAEMHLDRIHLGVEDLANYHVAWVLISSSFEIIEPIRSEITVVGRTWHSALDKLTFRRELTFTDQADRPLFHAVTFTVLMDTTTRRIVRPDKAYSKRLIDRVSSQYQINAPTLTGRLIGVLNAARAAARSPVFRLGLSPNTGVMSCGQYTALPMAA